MTETTEKTATRTQLPILRYAVRAGLAVVIAAATVWVFHDPIRNVAFMGDETDWITSGNYYTALVVKGDFEHAKWVANDLGIVGNFNQNLGKVLLGLGVRWHPNREPGDIEYLALYDWSKSYDMNRARGQVPPPGLLLRARQAELVFIAGIAVLLFFVGTMAGGELCGLVAAAVMLGSKTIHELLALAVTDNYYNFFFLMGLLASAGLIRAERTRSFVGWSALVGLAAGLACSVKITGLPMLAFYYGLLLLPIWRARGFTLRTTVYGPLAALAAAIITVYVLNPFFWPFESPRMLLEFPNLFVRTREAFGSITPEAAGWGSPPRRLTMIHERLFASDYLSFRGEPALFAIGLVITGWHLIRGLMEKKIDLLGTVFVYFLAQYVFVVALVQFNFARYFLPAVLSMKVMAGIGVAVPLWWIWNQMRRQRTGAEIGAPGAAEEAPPAATTASP